MKTADLLRTFALVGATTILCGCPTVHSQYLRQPQRVTVRGTYVHPPSSILMPENVGEFRRDAVLRYDTEGLDVSAGYNLVSSSHHVAATVYVYPAPPLASIGSSPDVVAGARARLTQSEFERRKAEIHRAHPDARLIEEGDTVRSEQGQSYLGKRAIFEFEEMFAGSRRAVRSHLYVFCYVGKKWAVEYRFTQPKSEDADKTVQAFIGNWHWYAE